MTGSLKLPDWSLFTAFEHGILTWRMSIKQETMKNGKKERKDNGKKERKKERKRMKENEMIERIN